MQVSWYVLYTFDKYYLYIIAAGIARGLQLSRPCQRAGGTALQGRSLLGHCPPAKLGRTLIRAIPLAFRLIGYMASCV
jgi:hypothetical protein